MGLRRDSVGVHGEPIARGGQYRIQEVRSRLSDRVYEHKFNHRAVSRETYQLQEK